MGYPTKIQLIKRKTSEQWYINFPAAVARAMEFVASETMEWIIEDKTQLVLRRAHTPPSVLKKKRPPDSLSNSSPSSSKSKTPLGRKGALSEPND